jgi:hypothetical protein
VIRRLCWLAVVSVFAVLVLAARALPQAPKEPVFIYLSMDVTDHVNLDITEDRLHRVLPEIEGYRKRFPAAHVRATVFFSGAVSDALAQRNSQTHIVDFVSGFVKRGVIEAGYDGADEPTYQHRPMLKISTTSTPEERWLARDTTAEKLLTEGRDPLTGAPEAGKDGGLKRMQEVFGPATCVKGVVIQVPDIAVHSMPEVGADSETVHEIQRYNKQAIMFGIPDSNPAHIPHFQSWAISFSKSMSPIPESSPEVYWQDNVLRSSESTTPSEEGDDDENDYHGLDTVKDDLGKLDRSKIRVIHVDLGDERYYLQPTYAWGVNYPPVKFAYDHPDHAVLPAEARRSAGDVDATYAKESTLLNWLAQEFFEANPGSRFVSSSELREMTPPPTGYEISVAGLRSAFAEMVSQWTTDTIPAPYLRVDGHYLSMADEFQAASDALATMDRTGKLPASVRVVQVYGPSVTSTDKGAATGDLTVASVAHECSEIATRLHDNEWSPVPRNSIPGQITVEGQKVNSAQFLRLMAEALVNPSANTKLTVKRASMFWGQDAVHFRSRSLADEGAAWTFKPAPLQVGATSQVAQARK